MDRAKIMTKARMGLMSPDTAAHGGSPVFYSSILFSLKLVWTDTIPTMGVDGKNLFVNEQFFCSLKPKVQVFTLAHESLHIGLRHIDTFDEYNRKVYSEKEERMLHNMAGDHVINLALQKAGYTLWEHCLCDDRFINMSTIQVYFILHDEYDPLKPPAAPAMGGDVIHTEDDGSSQAAQKKAQIQHEINVTLTKAKLAAEMAKENIGNVPGNIFRDLQNRISPRLPFEVLLANYMSAYAKEDFSYRRPNRRFLPDYYLPGAFSERLCNLATAFDISGSVRGKQLVSFRNGLRILKEELRPEKITLIQWDTDIRNIEPITEMSDVMQIKFHGGGGTNVQPLIDWIKNNKPEITLIFTDGEFYTPDFTGLTTDIIWLIEGDPDWKIDYGKVFHYEL
jgi:predicted metal-dependent peptidase